jgi:hypothetical protein
MRRGRKQQVGFTQSTTWFHAGIDLRRVLDAYISESFSGTMAHKHLMKCLKQTLDQMEEKSKVSKIIASLKVMLRCDRSWLSFQALEYLFKIIIASRLLSKSADDSWFKQDLLGVFQSFNQLMKKTSPGLSTYQLLNFLSFRISWSSSKRTEGSESQCLS